SGHAQGRAAVLDRLAAGGLALVRRAPGVAGNHRNTGKRQIELLGRDLLQRRENALPQLDLAGEDRGGAVGVDPDPAVEPPVVLQAAREPGGLLAQCRLRVERERNDQGAEACGEFASVECGSVHGQVLPLVSAARSTARMMRLWVPQRQRLPASAVRTSPSLGCGLRSSSSFAAMVMPFVQ